MPRKKNTRQHNVTRKVHESSAKNQRFAGGVNPKRKDMYIHSQGRPKPRPPRPRDHGEPYVPDYMQPYQYEDYLDGQGGGTSGGSGNRCECTINYGSFTGECIPSNSNYECAQGCTAFCNMFSANPATGNQPNNNYGECHALHPHVWPSNSCGGTNNFGYYMCHSGYECQQLNGWPQT